MADSYVINVWCHNLSARVSMNDCQVLRAMVPGDRIEQYDLSSWIIEEQENRLEVELASFDANTKLVGEGTRFFKIELHKRDPGRELSIHTVLTLYAWTENEGVLPVSGAPVVAFSHGWNVHEDDSYGRWSWEDAQPYLEKRDRDDVAALVQRVHSGLVTRHTGMLHTIFDTRYKDLSRAEGISFHDVKQRSEDFFKPFFEADDWRVRPLDLSSLRFVTEANGRMVRAYDANDTPALVGAGGGTTMIQDIAMANLDGVWVAVR